MPEKGKPTKSFMKHLEHREGNVTKSYLDSVGKLTGGIGHLLLEDEIKKYPEGTRIPREVREEWIQKDSVKAWDAAIDQAADLEKMFGLMSGRSKEQSAEFQKQVYALAEMNGVAPQVVMQDIANNMDEFAKSAQDGGMRLARAAIYGRKLGLTLDSMAATQEGLLDFQSSLTAEYEAEIMLGEDLNLVEARNFAMLDEKDKMMESLLANKAVENALEGDNLYKKMAVAKAMNMELKDLTAAYKLYKDTLKVQEDMSNVDPTNVVADETIDSVTAFHNSIKVISDMLADTFIPLLNMLMWPFVELGKLVANSEAAMIGLKIVMGALVAVFAKFAISAVIAGVAALWKAVGLASVSTFGWGGIAAAGIALTIISMMTSAMTNARSQVPQMAEGGMVSPTPGGTTVTVAEAGAPEVITPLDKLPGLVNVDNSGVAREVGSLKSEMKKQGELTRQMMVNFERYFGKGGTVARESGKAMVRAQESGVV